MLDAERPHLAPCVAPGAIVTPMNARHLFRATVFALLLVGPGAASRADPSIAATLDDIAPLTPGDRAPAFTALKSDGSTYEFRPGERERPALIIFYRGGWCGACNQQLRDVAKVIEDIRSLDVDVIFPNGDRPEILYSSLAQETQLAIDGLDFLLLSDSGLDAATAFGVAYVLDDETLARYRGRDHWDLDASSIDRFDALPLPSIFLVNTDGRIAFEYHHPDTRVRLPAEKLLKAVEDMVANRQ